MADPYSQALNIAAPFARLGSQMFQGQALYEQGRAKSALQEAQRSAMESHSGLYNAQAQKAQEEAAGLAQRRQAQSPEAALTFGARFAGLTDPQAVEIADYQKRGNWGEAPGYSLPEDQSGPTLPPMPKDQPSWYSPEVKQRFATAQLAHLSNMAATGNTDGVKLLESLIGEGRNQDAVRTGNFAPLNGLSAANKGQLYDFKEFGTGDNSTGKVAFNQPYLLKNKSEINENNAQAGNASAQASLHRAQIPEVQSRIDLNRSKIGGTETITNPDGTQTVVTSGKATKAPTEFQAKAAIYGARSKEAHDILNELELDTGAGKYSRLATAALGGGSTLGKLSNGALSESTQRVIQAQQDFLNAVLRQESGAVIGAEEFANGQRQYFPMPGDKPEVLLQKARNRETAIMGFGKAAGNAAYEAPPIAKYTRTGVLNGRKVGMLANGKTVYQDTGEEAK